MKVFNQAAVSVILDCTIMVGMEKKGVDLFSKSSKLFLRVAVCRVRCLGYSHPNFEIDQCPI